MALMLEGPLWAPTNVGNDLLVGVEMVGGAQ